MKADLLLCLITILFFTSCTDTKKDLLSQKYLIKRSISQLQKKSKY